MSFPSSTILTGTYVSTGSSQVINLPSDVVKFELVDLTYFGSAAASTLPVTAWWVPGLPAASAFVSNKTNGAATLAITSMITAGGFTFSSPLSQRLSNAVAITGATNANPVVVSTGSTAGLFAGDTVRVYGTTGALQYAGMDFTINTIVANTSFNLPYVGSAPGSAATAGFWRRVNVPPQFYPSNRYVTAITQASSAVITLSVTHNLTAGQLVRIYVPSQWGMTQMNGQLAMITAVNTSTNTITVNINSSSYTAFAWPTSAVAAAGMSFAQIVPVGENAINTTTYPYANLLDDATNNVSAYSMTIGTSVNGASSDNMLWIAYRGLISAQ